MSFESETQMTKPALNWLESQNLFVKREFATPWGVCDLVGASINLDRVIWRLSFGQIASLGTSRRIELLHLIPDIEEGKSITSKRLIKDLNIKATESELASDLKYLLGGKFVLEPKNGHFQKINGWMPLGNRTVAVELKLRRISEAISQAISHVKFASESYVGLPSKIAQRIANSYRRDEFQEPGIGLLAVGRQSCEVLIKPRTSNDDLDPVLRDYCVERFWKSHFINNSA